MLTENLIELRVERMTDSLDNQYMAGIIDRKTYDSAMRDLNTWAEYKYAETRWLGKET